MASNNILFNESQKIKSNINIIFMLSGVDKEAKTIFITSTIRGEGNTYIAINLALTFALLNKRVLLIGANIRTPNIAIYLKTKYLK